MIQYQENKKQPFTATGTLHKMHIATPLKVLREMLI